MDDKRGIVTITKTQHGPGSGVPTLDNLKLVLPKGNVMQAGGVTSVDVQLLGKLNPSLPLVQYCCEFYLLLEVTLVDEKWQSLLDKLTDMLAEQLARYLELACLGEARHFFFANKGWASEERGEQFTQFLTELSVASNSTNRKGVWLKWDAWYGRYGRQLHVWLCSIFSSICWSGGMGGPKWLTCIQTCLLYRRGRVGKVAFIDMAFGLEHNNNVAYDKLWKVGNLKYLLDCRRDGQIGELAPYASSTIRNIWEEVVGGKT